MARIVNKSAVFKHFKESEVQNVLLCQVTKDCGETCNLKISNKASNLKRHLERHHITIFKSLQEELKQKTYSGGRAGNVSTESTSSQQSSIDKYLTKKSVTVAMSKEIFEKYIIRMVENNGVALQLFSSAAFLGLNGEMASKLGVSLDRHAIRDMVIRKAVYQKNLVKEILHRKFCFLKMDACTRQRINYFAINVQFVDDNNSLAIRTLAVRDTKSQHTSAYIKDIVANVLEEYGISKEQVLAIVTDNASNMTSAIEKLNEYPTEADNELLGEITSQNDSLENELETESYDEETLFHAICDISELSRIEHMRCAVHTLQLAVRDGLKEKHVHTLISKLRQVVVIARTPKVDAILKRRAGKGAIIDQATRWGSTYLMIKRLLEIKSNLIDMAHPDITLTEFQWKQAEELEALLLHPFLLTKKLQEQELTPGSFYKEWKNLVFRLSQTGGIIADGIKDSMLIREIKLLDNSVLLAAIYVDPMHRVILTEEQLIRGKTALCDIAVRMKQFQEISSTANIESQSETIASVTSTSSSTASFHSDLQDNVDYDYEKYLDVETKRRKTDLENTNGKFNLSPLSKFKLDFTQALNEVEKIDRSSNMNVTQAIPYYPEIVKNVAYTVTALPPTQVSVERLFSALRFIRSDLRASMKEDLVEAILFLRSNYF